MANLIKICIKNLTLVCEKINSPLCDFFISESFKFNNRVAADIRAFQIFSRQKRVIPLLVVGGVTTLGLLAFMAANRRAIKNLSTQINKNIETLKCTINTTQDSFDTQQNMIKELDEKINRIGNKLNEYMESPDVFKKQSTILLVMLYLMRKHDNMHNRLANYFLGNHKRKPFSVIDFNDFLGKVGKINKKLFSVDRTASLPTFNNQNTTYLIRFSHVNIGNELSIMLDIPIMRGDKFKLFEMIPIPFKDCFMGGLSIINADSTFYLQRGQTFFVLNETDLFSTCEYTSEVTICDISLESMLLPPNGCSETLLLNGSSNNCILY